MRLTKEERQFIALIKDHGARAVPTGKALGFGWHGMGIKLLWWGKRETIGNRLLKLGALRFGDPVPGSNVREIEVVESPARQRNSGR
jgi:hypothetical protein